MRVLREYERGVVFRLGRLMEQRGPGLVTLVPGIDRMIRISLRTITLTVPPQEVITRDNVPVRVTAVAYYRVVDPNRAVVEVESYDQATLQIAQTTLRSVLGGADLDSLLGERERLNEDLQSGGASADEITKRAVLGLDGELPLFAHEIHYQIAANDGHG